MPRLEEGLHLRLPLPGQLLCFSQLIQRHGFRQMVLEFFSEVITLASRQGVPPIRGDVILRNTSSLGNYDPEGRCCIIAVNSLNLLRFHVCDEKRKLLNFLDFSGIMQQHRKG